MKGYVATNQSDQAQWQDRLYPFIELTDPYDLIWDEPEEAS